MRNLHFDWHANLSESDWQDIFEVFDEYGLIIFDNVIDHDRVKLLRQQFAPLVDMDVRGRNDFEGQRTNRVYSLLCKVPEFADLVMHPSVMAFTDRELGEECLLSSCLAINLLPGETAQPWHFDDGHISLPRPRPSYGVSSFWLFDDTTQTNGATEFLLGSHTWGAEPPTGSLVDEDFEKREDKLYEASDVNEKIFKATAKAGSVVICKGTIWHRGASNRSEASRLLVTPQYCPGWARQLENLMLAVPKEKAAKLPRRVQELIGYSIHPPFMGYVDGKHPAKLLHQ